MKLVKKSVQEEETWWKLPLGLPSGLVEVAGPPIVHRCPLLPSARQSKLGHIVAPLQCIKLYTFFKILRMLYGFWNCLKNSYAGFILFSHVFQNRRNNVIYICQIDYR